MRYALGVDVGTSATSAAVWRDGRADVVPLVGDRPTIPSVVFLQEDGSLLVGAEAEERGATSPDRVARAFRDDIADRVPRLLGEEAVPVVELVSALLEFAVAVVSARMGAPPSHVVLTCPASWRADRRTALTSAAEAAGLASVGLVTDPVAAAVHHAAGEHFPPGARLAVVDIGGSDLDVAVVVGGAGTYEVLGAPAGDPRMGGDVLDQVVLDHLLAVAQEAAGALHADGPDALAAQWRLRRAAVAAKEQLSRATQTEILLELPGLSRRVRYTRGEFEAVARPLVSDAAEVVRRAVEAAGLAPGDLEAVLLTGGSSAVPLVGEVMGNALGARVVLDSRPELAVCLGAALAGAGRLATEPVPGGPSDDDQDALVAATPDAPSPVWDRPGAPVDPEAAALVVDGVARIVADPADLGIDRPLDMRLPTRPDPTRARRPVVSERFVYDPPAARSWLRLVAVAAAVAAVLTVAGIAATVLRLDGDGGGAAGAAAPASTAPDGPPVAAVAAAGLQVLQGEGTTLAAASRAGAVVAAGSGAGGPLLWTGPVGALAPAPAPIVPGGTLGAVSDVAVTDQEIVAVGWSLPAGAAPEDRRARVGTLWQAPVSVTGADQWRSSQVPVAELTAVAALPDGSLLVAGVRYDVDAGDGDAVVLRWTGGDWVEEPLLGLPGPGPSRIEALAGAPGGGLIGVVDRLDGALVRPRLLHAPGSGPWSEPGAPLDAPGGGPARAEGVVADGERLVVVGTRARVAGTGDGLVWTLGHGTAGGATQGAPVDVAVVAGTASLSGVTVVDGGLLATGSGPDGAPVALTLTAPG